ncbi:MAG: lipoprotein-releasing ABC transporter ATP-binding protein LolD [Betaproteobacteria bacterium]
MASSPTVLACSQVTKDFALDDAKPIGVLKGVDLSVGIGESVSILGASGSGKSTLLHILGGLDDPTSGEVVIAGMRYNELTEKVRTRLRNKKVGFVYQFHHLLMEFTALENVMMPLMLNSEVVEDHEVLAERMLERVGLQNRISHLPSELSGGERQRVAIARALVNQPSILLADEPTGNLDKNSARQFMELVKELNDELKTSIVLVTHDLELASEMQRCFKLDDGHLMPV